MKINRQMMKKDGFTDREIDMVEAYCASAKASGTFSDEAALLRIPPDDELMLVCRTVAEIVDRLRPGFWLDKSENALNVTCGHQGEKS